MHDNDHEDRGEGGDSDDDNSDEDEAALRYVPLPESAWDWDASPVELLRTVISRAMPFVRFPVMPRSALIEINAMGVVDSRCVFAMVVYVKVPFRAT